MSKLSERIAALSVEKRARLTLELAQRLDALESDAREPIAIVGAGCRLPGAVGSLDSLWELLSRGGDAVTEVPPSRWDADEFYDPDPKAGGKACTRWGGFLDRVDEFDARFFGITRREACAMDPQHRLAMEVAWEALEDAGATPSLAGSNTGVFLGICNLDYSRMLPRDPARLSVYSAMGVAPNLLAGRLAYGFDLHGPAVTLDTACSSSLVAIHMASQSLRSGECRTALAGGVNLLLSPESTIAHSRLGFLAPDGRCKVFDARADGFVRGEGAGVLVLKRLRDALADGDRVHGLLRGSAVNQDGRTHALTAPSGAAQQAVVTQALERAGITPNQLGYVEAHGTGTILGDPIEIDALRAVLGPTPERRIPVGSIKANLGHLEAAAGVAGVLKVLAAFAHRAIPPQPHFRTLNPHISLEGSPLAIPQELEAWADGPRCAGVSSFGWSGTNAHVVLEEAPAVPAAEPAPGPQLIALSAKSPEALRMRAEHLAAHLQNGGAETPLADLAWTCALRRSAFEERQTFVASSTLELARQLEAYAKEPGAVAASEANSDLAAQGARWSQGEAVDFTALHPGERRLVDLPAYPWQRKRYWL